MKHILLVCSAGMSTSMLVSKMKDAAQKKNLEVTIDAVAQADVNSHLSKADIILLGPQVRFILDQVKSAAGDIPVEVIDMAAYGMMDGEKVLLSALKRLGEI